MADNLTTKFDATWDDGPAVKTFEDSDTNHWPAGVCSYVVSLGTPDILAAVSLTNPLPVQPGTGITFPVSAVSLPLPSGASTAANQSTGNTALAAIQTAVEIIDNAISGTEMQVDIVSSALPSGAATAANQATVISGIATLIGHVDGVEAALSPLALESGGNLAAAAASLALLDNAVSGNELQVDIVSLPAVDTELTTANLNTGIGTDTRAVVGLVYASATGGMLVDTTNPLPVQIPGSVTANTELNTAAAISAENNAAPTTASVYAFGLVFDGSNWDRAPGSSTDGLLVNLGANNDVTIGAALPAGGNTIGDVTLSGSALTALQLLDDIVFVDDDVFTPASSKVAAVGFLFDDVASDTVNEGDIGIGRMSVRREQYIQIRDAAGNERGTNVNASNELLVALSSVPSHNVTNAGTFEVQVSSALPAGTNAIGKLSANSGVDIGDVDVTSIAAGANLIGDVGLQPRTSGGLTIFRSLDLDETEEEVKATAGQIYGIIALNLATGVRYLKIYNATAANVTVGSTTPVMTIPIPTQAATANGAGFVLMLPQGITFDTAITVAATTGVADADTGAPGANEIVINVLYK